MRQVNIAASTVCLERRQGRVTGISVNMLTYCSAAPEGTDKKLSQSNREFAFTSRAK